MNLAPATERVCEWCRGPIPAGKRSDSRTCSKPCRQAKARFRVTRAPAGATDRPCTFGYADPPYPGLAWKYYRHPEVDHAELIARLERDFPDGWALSTSAEALQQVLALCPPGVRVGVWVRGARYVPSRTALHAWEPVIVARGRPRREPAIDDLVDVLQWGGRQHSHPGALVGMKPAPFCEWMFRLLGARRGDSLVDVFPGSGAVQRAWDLYVSPEVLDDASRAPRGDLSDGADGDVSRRYQPDASHLEHGDVSRAAVGDVPDDASRGPGRDLSRKYSETRRGFQEGAER